MCRSTLSNSSKKEHVLNFDTVINPGVFEPCGRSCIMRWLYLFVDHL